MKGPDGFVQGYNAQVAVDGLQLIVSHAVTQDTNDKHQLLPMITDRPTVGDAPPLADAGYCSEENLAAVADTGSTPTSRRATETRRTPGPVSARRCRRPPRASTGWLGSCSRRPARPSTPGAKRSSNR